MPYLSLIIQNLFYLILSFSSVQDVPADEVTVHFALDLNSLTTTTETLDAVGIRGNLPPLSWKDTFLLEDDNDDGIFTGSVVFLEGSKNQNLEYKYVYGNLTWELASDQNRVLPLDSLVIELPVQQWDKNIPPYLDALENTVLSLDQIKEDFTVMKEAVLSLHPGLYRYKSPEHVNGLFDAFEASLDAPMTYGEAYLAFSRFVPQLLCGHTLVNPWNQDAQTKALLFEKADKVPFTFKLIDRTMIVTKSVASEIQEGAEITAINGTPVSDIINTLMAYVSADGSNDGKRVYELQLTGQGEHELFDIYFPLVYPPSENGYMISGITGKTSAAFKSTVKPVSREARKALIAAKYGPQPETYDDLWQFAMLDDKTGYLQLGTYVTYKMTMDWKGFMKEAFEQLNKQAVPNLVIDIRGNAGGMDEVNRELLRYITKETISIPATQDRMAYSRVPDSVRPYVGTWNDNVFDLSSRVEDTGKGYYVYKNARTAPYVYKPSGDAYQGNVILLVDAANSSATFFLARVAKANNIATLVGQPTGGNLKGTNGGQMFFLRLPHSKVEVDIPIYGFFPEDEQPDRGVIPDVVVTPSVEDAQQGVDTILQAALARIPTSSRTQ